MKANLLPLVSLTILGTGCCIIWSGTWEDDPKNFDRAWGVAKPADLEMVHSWYWRSPHFFREETYFFEFRKNDEFLQGFVAVNNMEPEVFDPRCGFSVQKPSRFLPKPLDAYGAWSNGQAWLFSDRETGEIFIYVSEY
jgi:hypothetical protein